MKKTTDQAYEILEDAATNTNQWPREKATVGPKRHVQIFDPITKGLLSNPRQWRHKTCWNQIRVYTKVITQLPKRLLSNPW